MLSLSKHTARVWSDSGLTEFTPTDISVQIEETWSPYIQASITVPSALFTEALDPRTGGRLRLRLQQQFGELIQPWQLTNVFGGSVAAITANYSPGIKPREITDDFTRPWNMFEQAYTIAYLTANKGGTVSTYTSSFTGDVSNVSKYLHGAGTFNPAPSTVFEANLGIRSISRNKLEGITVVALSSDEALLQDRAWTSATPYTPTTTDVRTLANVVLSYIGASLAAGTTTGTFDNTKVKWLPGQSGWDFINPIVQKANLVLYCDENRAWQLVTASSVSGSLTLDDTSNVLELTSSLNRSSDWFDSAVVEYSWYNGTAQETAYDIYAPVGSVKTANIKIVDTPYPGTGMAQALTQRAQTRGEIFQLEAISNYNARPRQNLTVDITGEPLKTAVISSISWSLPADTMAISIRNLIEV